LLHAMAGAKAEDKAKRKGSGKVTKAAKVAKGKKGDAQDLEKKGKKRKAGKAVEGKPEKAADDKKSSKKSLNRRQSRRKEVTSLYAELINPGRERKADDLVRDILELLDQRASTLVEFCASELGTRVVQACLKWGSREQRCKLLSSLKDHIPKLSIDRFGHVVVLKLLTYAMKTSTERKPSEEEKKAQAQNLRLFLEAFRGKHLHAAFYHKYGCRVINGIYFSDVVSAKEKRRLLHDVAVPQTVALLRPELPGSKTLRQLLTSEDLTTEQRASISSHLREAAEKAVDKELLGFDIVHFIFQAFCEQATEAQLKDLAEKCMGGAPYLLSSKPGAEALLRLLGVATAKQRKELCRDLKGKFAALATNAVDYVVMIRLATTIDDTVLLGKTMLAEWKTDLATIVFDKYGAKVLAWLFRPDDSRIFSPYERQCVVLPAPASLKAPETRRQELIRVIRPPLRKVLMEAPLKAADDQHAKDLLLAYLAADWDAELIEAILAAGEGECKQEEMGLLNSGTTTTTLIGLLRLEPKEVDASLASQMWSRCLEPHLIAAVASRCAFLILELLKHRGTTRDAILRVFKQKRAKVEAAVKAAEAAGNVVNAAKKLLAALDGDAPAK